MDKASDAGRRLPSAGEDLARAELEPETAQTRSPRYRLAYADLDFLLRDELRPLRLQLEQLKPPTAAPMTSAPRASGST